MYIYLILSVPLQYSCKNTTEHLRFNKYLKHFKKSFFLVVNVHSKKNMKEIKTWGINGKTIFILNKEQPQTRFIIFQKLKHVS